uniref:Uncharacterized protein n=1 Tax=Pristionchus pacificus TaxID=54126 RepID=A0A2A6BNF2_PRIPA|eukprot:PDM67434.1 hypothetical protein PRIPAC_48851 [Pristionchus pacificus]
MIKGYDELVVLRFALVAKEAAMNNMCFTCPTREQLTLVLLSRDEGANELLARLCVEGKGVLEMNSGCWVVTNRLVVERRQDDDLLHADDPLTSVDRVLDILAFVNAV